MKRILSHCIIVLSLFYATLFVIDRVNMYMAFIDNLGTKILVLLLAILASVCAVDTIMTEREKQRRAYRRQQKELAKKKAAKKTAVKAK